MLAYSNCSDSVIMVCSMTLVSVDMNVRTKEDQKVAVTFMALTGGSRVLFQG